MIGVVAAIIAALGAGGLLLFVDGMTRQPPVSKSRPTKSGSKLWKALTVRERQVAACASVAGLVAGLVTGWVVLIVALPVAAVGVPRLVNSTSMKRSTDRLQALEDWTRSLSGVLTSGLILENAIQASRRAAPAAISKEVSALCARLRTGTSTDTALRHFAKDMDDATADLVALMLIEASTFQGVALAEQLNGVATSVSEDVRARRQILAAQREPQSNAALMTWITVASLILIACMGDYIAPYGSPLGQVIFAVLLCGFASQLIWMKQIATLPPPPRILGATSRQVDPKRKANR